VIRTGIDDIVVESICNELFQLNRELFAEEELDEAGYIIYQPPPLHEAWLDEAGRGQGPVTDNGPDMLPISDDGSIDIESSLYTRDSESEGGIWDYHDDDNVSIAPEGAQLIPPYVDENNGTPMIGSPVGSPVGRQNDGDNLPPNIVPAPIQAPEGATRRHCDKAKQYPPAVWRRGGDGKLKRIAMSVVPREYKTLNCDIFALTIGHHNITSMAQRMSQKIQRLNYKQYLASFRQSSDMALMTLTLDKTIPTIADLLARSLAKYITLVANDYGYSGTAQELIVSYVHPLFLKAHLAASKADNPSW
jgi:hypothetical protein